MTWACSAVGSAPHSHCGGREFESLQVHQKRSTPGRVCFIFAWLGRFEPSHATVRWTVAHRRLDGDGSIVFRISSSPPKKKHTREGVLHFCLAGEIRTIPCNGPVDRCPSPAGRRWLHSVSNLFKSTKNEAHPGGCASFFNPVNVMFTGFSSVPAAICKVAFVWRSPWKGITGSLSFSALSAC